jgi:hypothetical protein
MTGGNFSFASVWSCPVSAAGDGPSALWRSWRRISANEAKGRYGTTTRTDRNGAETTGTTRKVGAESAVGRWPNTALQRIAARWRLSISRKDTSGPLSVRGGVGQTTRWGMQCCFRFLGKPPLGRITVYALAFSHLEI